MAVEAAFTGLTTSDIVSSFCVRWTALALDHPFNEKRDLTVTVTGHRGYLRFRCSTSSPSIFGLKTRTFKKISR